MNKLFLSILFIIISNIVLSQPNPQDEYAFRTIYYFHYQDDKLISHERRYIIITGNHKKKQLEVGDNIITYQPIRVFDDTENGNFTVIESIGFDKDNKTLHFLYYIDKDHTGKSHLAFIYMTGEIHIYFCEVLY